MIIDTHQHFWNLGTPWAKAPEDYKILAIQEGITGTILRLEDTQQALDLSAQDDFIVGVCGAIKSGPNFKNELDKFSSNPLFRGICYLGRDLENVEKGDFLSNMEQLAAKDLELDLLRVCPVFYGGPKAMQKAYKGTKQSFEGMLSIAKQFPDLRIVVEHIGGMAIDGNRITPEWEDMFKRIEECPQIFIKVSGLMERATTRTDNERSTELLSFYRQALDAVFNIFGEDRLMYGSNWPVSEHVGDYIVNGIRIVRQYFSEKGESAYTKYFWENSKRCYKWQPRLPSQM